MDVIRFSRTVTVGKFEEACEVWYNRLNTLKEIQGDDRYDQTKLDRIIRAMIKRMTDAAPIFSTIQQSKTQLSTRKFKPGGVL